MFQHRRYAVRNCNPNTLEGEWVVMGQGDTGVDTCRVNATTFTHHGQLHHLINQED